MRFFTDFFSAFIRFFTSFSFILNKGIWHFLLYPFFVLFALYLFSFWGVLNLSDYLKLFVLNSESFLYLKNETWFFSWLNEIPEGFFGLMINILLKIIFWWIGGTLLKYLTLIFLSPILAVLSEKVEEKISGVKYKFSVIQWLREILRSILLNLRNMFLEYGILFISTLLSFLFPPLAIFLVPVSLIFSWYFLGFSVIDYSLERKRFSIQQSVAFARKNSGILCGTGCAFWLMGILPGILGFLGYAIVAPVPAVVSSTILFLKINNESKFS